MYQALPGRRAAAAQACRDGQGPGDSELAPGRTAPLPQSCLPVPERILVTIRNQLPRPLSPCNPFCIIWATSGTLSLEPRPGNLGPLFEFVASEIDCGWGQANHVAGLFERTKECK